MRMSINTPEDVTVNEQFIKLVEETPVLWNIHLPIFRNRELKVQKWAEVGAPFNLTGPEAYKKFVALREKYKREQKLRAAKTVSDAECWRLFDKMKFLDSVSFSRDRRWSKPKLSKNQQYSFPLSLLKQDLSSFIKTERPDMHICSAPTSPNYQMYKEPSENESNETYQENSDFFNDSTMNGSNSEAADYAEKIESIPDVHPAETVANSSVSQEQQFLNRLEMKTDVILNDYNRRKHSWARCETLGQRVAQTMYALEENDPDLALKFDIILGEAITSIKKDQLQRLLLRQEQRRRDDELGEQHESRSTQGSSDYQQPGGDRTVIHY